MISSGANAIAANQFQHQTVSQNVVFHVDFMRSGSLRKGCKLRETCQNFGILAETLMIKTAARGVIAARSTAAPEGP